MRKTAAAGHAAAFGLICAVFAWIHRADAADLFNPWRVTNDARQWIGPLWRHHDPALLDGDGMTDYMRALTPDGYEALYLLFSGLEPVLYGKLLSLALLLLTLALVWAATVRVSRSLPAGAAAVALALVYGDIVRATAGGLPRSFVPPLVAGCAWALVAQRVRVLAALPVLAGWLYPPMALGLGGVLALRSIGAGVRPAADLLRRAPDRKQMAVLALAGGLTLLAVATQVHAAREYGPRIDSTRPADRAAFPEHLGRHGPRLASRSGSPDVFLTALRYPQARLRFLAPSVFSGAGGLTHAPWVLGLLLWAGAGWVLLTVPRARPLLLLLTAAAASGVLALLFHPLFYYASRHLDMPLRVLMVMAMPLLAVAAADRLRRIAPRARVGAAAVNLGIVGLAVAVSAAGGHGSPLNGTSVDPAAWRRPYTYMQTLPADALIAGWNEAIANNVVLLTGRRALIGEVDLFHRGHVLDVRRRTRALIEASFSSRHRALPDLRDTFGVTHLVIDSAHFFRMPPSHSVEPPFKTWARRRWAHLRDSGETAAAIRCRTDAAVYDDGRYFILDLRTIPSDACRRRT